MAKPARIFLCPGVAQVTQHEQCVHHFLPEDWNQVKNPLAMWETQVHSLDPEDPLEKEMATPLAWKIPRTEEPG